MIERAGVAKASLYSTFGSKEELVHAYLDERHARDVGRLRAAAAAVEDPAERILAVFDAQAAIFRQPAFVAARLRPPRPRRRAGGRIDEATESYRDDVRGAVRRAGGAGRRSPDPALLASQLQMIYDGASLSVKMDHDPDVAVAQRIAAAALVQAALAS